MWEGKNEFESVKTEVRMMELNGEKEQKNEARDKVDNTATPVNSRIPHLIE